MKKFLSILIVPLGCLLMNSCKPLTYEDWEVSDKELVDNQIEVAPYIKAYKIKQEGHDMWLYKYNFSDAGGISIVHSFECEKCKSKIHRRYEEF